MTVTLPLPPEMEAALRADAQREGVPVEVVVTRRLEEAQLLHRIVTAFPQAETREFRALVAGHRSGTLSPERQERLTALAQRREEQNADRLFDILALARLRGVSHRALMDELGIRPARIA